MDDFLNGLGTKPEFNEDGTLKDTSQTEKAEETVVSEKTDEIEKAVGKTEEVTEEKVESTEEAKKEDVETDAEFNFDSFKAFVKTKFEKEIDTEDALAEYFTKAGEYDEIKTKLSELKQTKAELESLVSKSVNGRDWFVSDDEFIRQQFLKNSEGKFSESALSILSGLSPDKVKGLDAIEAIKVKMMVDNPELDKSDVEELVKADLGVDDLIVDEWDALPKAKMKRMASEARKSLGELYNGIEIPKAVDIQSRNENLTSVWNEPLKATIDGITSLGLSEDTKFDLTSEMKEGLQQEIMSEILISGIKPSEEALGDIAGKIRSKMLERNLDAILKVVDDAANEKWKAHYQGKVHNTSPLNNDKRVDDVSDDGVLSGRAIVDAF